jgi:hypothetical protein
VAAAGSSIGPSRVLHPATRCGECHGAIAKEWKTSAHARAESSALYAAMRSKTDRDACDRCHAPLAKLAEADNFAIHDAVGCDVCHTVREVSTPGTYEMHLNDIVKYGPLCDAKDNYFHKVGCSPFHGTSEFCSACHSLTWHTPGGETLTVQSEFEEWRGSLYGGSRIECQSCHMPGAHDAVAVGSPARPGVPNHAFSLDELRKTALAVSVTVRDVGKNLDVSVALKNNHAGHDIPSGLPERRLILRTSIVDAAGTSLKSAEHSYGRVLVDEQGPAPFYAATRAAEDSRIAPLETRQQDFQLPAPDRGSVDVTVVFVDVAPDIARRLDIASSEEIVAKVTVPFGPRGPGGAHAHLPKTVEP